ncbi:hypothetical protein EYF80_059288 [Liparis tanakae]|uniref:Uncharacterized protein n=1 Tax=Liparis tanakae TaxID=230148 RepID=A0A4Z2EP64_9TELE|nr:hypothetical protein EYF80_059288 [Liparis tanakae]
MKVEEEEEEESRNTAELKLRSASSSPPACRGLYGPWAGTPLLHGNPLMLRLHEAELCDESWVKEELHE